VAISMLLFWHFSGEAFWWFNKSLSVKRVGEKYGEGDMFSTLGWITCVKLCINNTICSSLRQFMIENWRLLGGVRVGLSLCAGRDSLLCLLRICSHCLTTLPVQLEIMTECF